ncbi:MAG: hypothetical protein AAF597_08520 [Bacteroidota bacterium]
MGAVFHIKKAGCSEAEANRLSAWEGLHAVVPLPRRGRNLNGYRTVRTGNIERGILTQYGNRSVSWCRDRIDRNGTTGSRTAIAGGE